MTGPDGDRVVPAWWRLLTIPVLAALATALGTYAAQAPLPRAIAVGVVIGATTWLLLRGLLADPEHWPDTPLPDRDPGTIAHPWEISGLDTALARPEFRPQRLLDRLAVLAERLLARHGVELGSPAARQLLGDRTVRVLTEPEGIELRRGELPAIIERLTLLATRSDDAAGPLPVDPGLLRRTRRLPVLRVPGLRRPHPPRRDAGAGATTDPTPTPIPGADR